MREIAEAMSLTDWVMLGLVIGIIVLPPKWDPAILLKEWLERHR
jgi:hypothetical protein